MNIKNQIKIKSPQEVKILKEAGKILASVIKELTCSLRIGMSTAQIDAVTESLIKKHKVKPAFKGYRGYPACACVSVNEEVVHGIPSDRRFVDEGDIVSIDVGIIHQDYYSDTAITVGIGKIHEDLQKLLDVTQKALHLGIAQARPGNHLTDISHAIQQYVEARHYGVVREFVGHGIGKNLHEEPEIPNFGQPKCGPVLKAGMVFAIEPMVNVGTWKTKILEDGWTVVTADGKPSAHFEHTIVITAKGPEILTKTNG